MLEVSTAPTLVLDNGDGHHNHQVEAYLTSFGIDIVHTPAGTPLYNIIEETYSQADAYVVRHYHHRQGCDKETLIREAFASITPAHCANYFRHHGYV